MILFNKNKKGKGPSCFILGEASPDMRMLNDSCAQWRECWRSRFDLLRLILHFFHWNQKKFFPLAIFDFNSNRIAINGLFHWFQTGHIRTSSGSYFIEPHPTGSERPEDADTDPVRQVIYGLRPGTFHGDDPLTAPATQSVDQSAPSARQGQFSFNSN